MMKKLFSVLLCLLLLLSAVFVSLSISYGKIDSKIKSKISELEELNGDYDPYSIILANTDKNEAREISSRLGGELRISQSGSFATVTLQNKTVLEVISDRENYDILDRITFDRTVKTADIKGTDNGADYTEYMSLEGVWDKYTGEGITVAVIDTGIDTDNPEFEDRISDKSYSVTLGKNVRDFGGDYSIVEDTNGHGTAVSGVLAAGHNGYGTTGVAPDAEIVMIKVECNEYGSYSRASDLVFGMYYAIDIGVDVINMSFAVYGTDIFTDAVNTAAEKGIICVAAAGNNASTSPTYPAVCENAIGVGALNGDLTSLSDYSNYGDNTFCVAPGTVYTSAINGIYTEAEGTSFSSAVVAGAVALLKQKDSSIAVKDAKKLISSSAEDKGAEGYDKYYGNGLVDIYSLLFDESGEVLFDTLSSDGVVSLPYTVGKTIKEPPIPKNGEKLFAGWYYGVEYNDAFEASDRIYEDTTLYAKWIDEDDGSYEYELKTDGTLRLKKYNGDGYYVIVPDSVNGKTVTEIGEEAFKNCKAHEVYLTDNITEISDSAFENCKSLQRIRIPNTVVKIGSKAYYGCRSLSYIEYGDNSRLTSIGKYAFGNCISLIEYKITKNVISLDGTAFFGDIGIGRYSVEKNNSEYVIMQGIVITSDMKTVVACPPKLSGALSLLYSTENIGEGAFAYSSLETLNFSSRIKKIGRNAFAEAEFITDCFDGGVASHNGWVIEIDKKAELIDLTDYSGIAAGAFDNADSLKQLITDDIIKGGELDVVRGVTVFSKMASDDLGKYGGNTVYFSGEWIYARYCDNEGDLISFEYIKCGDILSFPTMERFKYGGEYIFSGWDINGDGQTDEITVAGNKDIKAIAVYKKYNKCENKGHSPGEPATCTEDCRCTECGAVINKRLGHDIVHHGGKAPTCTVDGYEEYDTCTRCSYTTFKSIDSLGHDKLHHDGKAPTCTEDGYKEYDTCTRCSYTTFISIDSLGHDIIHHGGKAPTCTEDGYEEYDSCSRCKYTTFVSIDSLGHDIIHHNGKAPTCTENGYEEYDTCTRCIYTTSKSIDSLGHDIIHHNGKAPTCTEDGYEEYDTCAWCSYTTFVSIDSLGHDIIHHGGKAPTCTEDGYKDYITCSRCSFNTYTSISQTGHKYSAEWTVDKPPSYTEIGEKSHHCLYCSERECVTEIPALRRVINYTDVKASDWYYEAVCYVFSFDLMTGTSDNAFSPRDYLTRGMAVMILWRLEKTPAIQDECPFEDIADSPYSDAVIWAYNNHIVDGISENKYSPSEKITREQMVKLLYRYCTYKGKATDIGKKNDKYSDISTVSLWAEIPMMWATSSGLVVGNNGLILPRCYITRAETAQLISRCISE